jgi:hypothetical protein
MARQATLLVADEIYYNLQGKAILQGIYQTDLVITTDPQPAPQLIFYFIIEGDATDPFRSLEVEVALPGSEPIRRSVRITTTVPAEVVANKGRVFLRYPLLAPALLLRPGRIEAKVIHENGEIVVRTHAIVLTAQPQSEKPN